MQKALNDQIANELGASMEYLALTAYFESINLKGIATWMRLQADEEKDHAMKIFDYVHDRKGRVVVSELPAPDSEFDGPMAAFKAAETLEQANTARINAIVDLAREERDYATDSFMQWFVTEQVEEEASLDEIINSLELVAGSKQGLYHLDRELGQRQPSAG
jgi:ferritin